MRDCQSDIVLFFRLLTLWFDYGHISEVSNALSDGIKTIDIDNWLQVIYIKRCNNLTTRNTCYCLGYSPAHSSDRLPSQEGQQVNS